MRVIVFGGSGFLGGHLVDMLIDRGHEVTVYGRASSKRMRLLKNTAVNLVYGDFSMESDFLSFIDGYDCVYHLVSATVPGNNNPQLELKKIIEPTLKLLDACVKSNVGKFIFFSSGGAIYGVPTEIPISEDAMTSPISAYGVHKLIIESYLEYYYKMYGLQYLSLRISNPYGVRQRAFSNQGLIANVLGHYLTNKAVPIYGDGSTIRDYIYVTDVVDVAEKFIHYHGQYRIFNVGSGHGTSINEIISTIEQIVGDNLKIISLKENKMYL